MAPAMPHMLCPDHGRHRGHARDCPMPAARGGDHQSPRGEDGADDEGRTQVRVTARPRSLVRGLVIT